MPALRGTKACLVHSPKMRQAVAAARVAGGKARARQVAAARAEALRERAQGSQVTTSSLLKDPEVPKPVEAQGEVKVERPRESVEPGLASWVPRHGRPVPSWLNPSVLEFRDREARRAECHEMTWRERWNRGV
jgi:hypothetical protein